MGLFFSFVFASSLPLWELHFSPQQKPPLPDRPPEDTMAGPLATYLPFLSKSTTIHELQQL